MAQAIIMAGGEGSRLRPLTCDRPKPMVPMLNQPVMHHAVELLKSHNINDIGVTLQYMPQEIMNYFGDGSLFGVNMRYFLEETPLGTAGSVKNAEGFIKDTFIVVSGDALTDFNLSEAVRFHREKGAIATMVLTPVEIPLEYGVVIIDDSGHVRQFLEKPGWGEVFSDTVNTGIYILEPEVLDYIPRGQKYDFSKDLFPAILKDNKPLFGVSLTGYWCDIGNLKQYQEAHYSAMEGRVTVHIGYEALPDKVFRGEGCNIDPTAKIIGPVIIGNNCSIGKNTVLGPYVVLGDNCKIDDGASIKKGVVWNGSYIGRGTEIRGAVICEKVSVKDRVSIFEGAVVGDGSIIEENSKIRPDTKIWPQKHVDKGSVVSNNLIWGSKACRNLFGVDGVSGKINDSLTPECAAKLGAVYGKILKSGSRVLVSSDFHAGTRMLKMALQSGLMSVGAKVYDGGDMIAPVHRFAVRALELNGGVHIKSSVQDPETLHINFFIENGVSIPRDMERKIENQYERDDFQRNAKTQVGTVTYISEINDAYLKQVFNSVNPDKIRARRLRTVISYGGPNLRTLIPAFFKYFDCDTVDLGMDSEFNGYDHMKETANQLAKEVTQFNADFGVVFDSNAEHIILIDENGRVIEDELFMALMSYIIMESFERPVVAVPVSGSQVIEELARNKERNVVRTKTARSEIMNNSDSVITFDALSTLARIMNFMALRDNKLSYIVSEIPEIYMSRKTTECSWVSKGKVMRQLIQETQGQQTELLDGIKVYHEDGWALVLPDAEEPRYHVFAEGNSYEFAESLADFYIDKINQLK